MMQPKASSLLLILEPIYPIPTIPTLLPPTLEARGKLPMRGHDPARTNRSEAETRRRTSIKRPTAKSATLSEKVSALLVTRTPRRRHSSRSTWSRPALVPSTHSREGYRSNVSDVTGGRPKQMRTRADFDRAKRAGSESECGSITR